MSVDGRDGGVVYEVALDVDAEVGDAFRAWLDAHVREILALPGFIDARLSQQSLFAWVLGVPVRPETEPSTSVSGVIRTTNWLPPPAVTEKLPTAGETEGVNTVFVSIAVAV